MLGNLFNHIPPVTQVLLLITGTIGLLTYGEIVDKYNLYFSFDKIFYQGQVKNKIKSGVEIIDIFGVFQAVKHVLFAAALLFVLMKQLSINISSSIERSSFKRGSIDFLYFLILMSGMIFLFAIMLKINFLSNIFIYAMYYYYGRIHSDRIIIINFLPMRASFMIWFILLIEWIFGSHDLKSCVLSVVIGHSLYFLYNVYPKLRLVENKQLFDTPNFFVRMVSPLFNEAHVHRNNQQDDGFF